MNLAIFAAEKPHISLASETIFTVAGIPITNTILLGLVGYSIVLALLFYVAFSVKRGRMNKLVVGIQWIYEILLDTIEQVIPDKATARRLAPLVITMFFCIIINYWLGVLPFVGDAVTYHGTPLLRPLPSDMNVTFALAIISMIMAQIYAIRVHGVLGNAKRYLRNPIKDPTGAFEGILEFIAEFSRGTALSLRLFGNVFAGEVLLLMVGYLSSYLSPLALPVFMLFEIFMGAIQAYVFFMLTTVFVSLAVAHHGDESTSKATS
ncbi:MAG: F0F1 ATP synthase subunit A [Candidatus Saccharibacteria bacterium]|nr:F0F1 ATP synthase subunit A [Candidatus Saccharibacteria bacterium]